MCLKSLISNLHVHEFKSIYTTTKKKHVQHFTVDKNLRLVSLYYHLSNATGKIIIPVTGGQSADCLD